jgi:hypothetical protein
MTFVKGRLAQDAAQGTVSTNSTNNIRYNSIVPVGVEALSLESYNVASSLQYGLSFYNAWFATL